MTDTNPIEPLVTGTKRATVHFAKAAFEVASGVGAFLRGVTRTVRPEPDDAEGTGPQKVEID
jgi:hypothetical protein